MLVRRTIANMELPTGNDDDGYGHYYEGFKAKNTDNKNGSSTKLSPEELAAAVGNVTLVPLSQRRRSSMSTLSAGSELVLPPSALARTGTNIAAGNHRAGERKHKHNHHGGGRSNSNTRAEPPAPPAGTFNKRGSSGYRRRSSTGIPSQIVSSSAGSSMAHAAAIVRAMGLDIDDLSDDDYEDDDYEDEDFGGTSSSGAGAGAGAAAHNFAEEEEEDSLRLAQAMPPPNTNTSCTAGGATPPRATERKKRASVLSKELVIDEDSDEDNDNRKADNERRRQRESVYEAKQERAETARRASLEASGDFAYDGSSGSLGRLISANELDRLQAASLSSQSHFHSRSQVSAAIEADQEAWNARKDKVYRRTSRGSTGGLISYSELSLDSFNTNDTGSTTSVAECRRPPTTTATTGSDRGHHHHQQERRQQQSKPRPFRRTSHGSLGVMSFGELSMDSEDSSLSDTISSKPGAQVATSNNDIVDSSNADNSHEESTSSLPQECIFTLNDGRQDNPTTSSTRNTDTVEDNAKPQRPFRRTSNGSRGVMSYGSLSLNSDSTTSDTTASTYGVPRDNTTGSSAGGKGINRHRTASTADESTSNTTAELTYENVERLRPEATMPLKDHSRQPGNSRPCPHTQVYRRSSQGSLGKHLSYGELSLLSTDSSIRSRDP